MRAILLDGSHASDGTGDRVRAALTGRLQASGWSTEHVILRESKVGNCAGDFFCWTRTPGVCNVDDDNRTIAAAIVASDLLVYLTPVAFGGYSSTLKRMVDHQIQIISPFFTKVEGETHHQVRYQKYPNFLAVGWMDATNALADTVFRHLVQRNAINFHARTYVSDVVLATQSDEEISASAQEWLDRLRIGESSPQVALPPPNTLRSETSQVRRALLLVGSPRLLKSTSHSLGSYLCERLGAESIPSDTICLHTVLRSQEKMQALLDAVDGSDLLILTFPLYVDSLAAPAIEALERIAEHRKSPPAGGKLFAAVANCGFPEAHQNATALAICGTFAQQAGFEWAGGLALGGGEMVGGMPLEQAGGKTLRIRKSLDLAAEALARAQPIPAEAQNLMAKPVIPHWLYRFMGDMHWKKQAKGYGVKASLRDRPYSPDPKRT